MNYGTYTMAKQIYDLEKDEYVDVAETTTATEEKTDKSETKEEESEEEEEDEDSDY